MQENIMQLPLYRKNVFKTLSIKPAKAGLRYTTRNTLRTNVLHAALGLATEVGELLEVAQPYLLEGRMSAEAKDAAFEEMGDIGYYLVVMAKSLKVKMPGAGKKIKLLGTRGKALLDMSKLITDILSVAKKTMYGVKEKEHIKDVPAKAAVGDKPAEPASKKTVMVFDAEAQAKVDADRTMELQVLMGKLIDVYYRLCYEMFGMPPAGVFAGNIAKLSHRYADGFFDQEKATAPHDPKAEQAIAKAAAPAAVKKSPAKKAAPAAVGADQAKAA